MRHWEERYLSYLDKRPAARSVISGVLPSFFSWLMRDFVWLISIRFAFTLLFTYES